MKLQVLNRSFGKVMIAAFIAVTVATASAQVRQGTGVATAVSTLILTADRQSGRDALFNAATVSGLITIAIPGNGETPTQGTNMR